MLNNDYLREDIVRDPQPVTGTFADLGISLNVLRWGNLSLFMSVLVGNSTAIQIKPLIRDKGEDTWFDLPIKQGLSTRTFVGQGVYEFTYLADFNVCFDVDVSGVGEIKFQIKGTGNVPVPGIVTKCFAQLTPGGE